MEKFRLLAGVVAGIFLTVVILTSSSSAGSRSPLQKNKIRIETENGVCVVKNPREPLYGEITLELEKVRAIGDEKDENAAFFQTICFMIDDEENFIVVDGGNRLVKKFDKNGKFLQTIGRTGQGPGEYEYPRWADRDAQGNLYILGGSKIQVFDAYGKFKKSFPVILIELSFFLTGDNNILTSTTTMKSSVEEWIQEIVLLDENGVKIKSIKSCPSFMRNQIYVNAGGVTQGIQVNWDYSPWLFLSPSGSGRAIYARSDEYRIYFLDGTGKVTSIIEKDEPAIAITGKEKDNIISEAIESAEKYFKVKPDRSKVETAAHFGKIRPYISSVVSDDEGNIYVVRRKSVLDKSKTGEIDFFDREGRCLYRMIFPFKLRIIDLIRKGYVYRAETDPESGYIRIVQYRIKNSAKIKKYAGSKE